MDKHGLQRCPETNPASTSGLTLLPRQCNGDHLLQPRRKGLPGTVGAAPRPPCLQPKYKPNAAFTRPHTKGKGTGFSDPCGRAAATVVFWGSPLHLAWWVATNLAVWPLERCEPRHGNLTFKTGASPSNPSTCPSKGHRKRASNGSLTAGLAGSLCFSTLAGLPDICLPAVFTSTGMAAAGHMSSYAISFMRSRQWPGYRCFLSLSLLRRQEKELSFDTARDFHAG